MSIFTSTGDNSLDPYALRSLYRRQKILRERLARKHVSFRPVKYRSWSDMEISHGALSLADIESNWRKKAKRSQPRKGTWQSNDGRKSAMMQEYMRNSMHLSQPFWWRIIGEHGRKPLHDPEAMIVTPYDQAYRARKEWHRTIKAEKRYLMFEELFVEQCYVVCDPIRSSDDFTDEISDLEIV